MKIRMTTYPSRGDTTDVRSYALVVLDSHSDQNILFMAIVIIIMIFLDGKQKYSHTHWKGKSKRQRLLTMTTTICFV